MLLFWQVVSRNRYFPQFRLRIDTSDDPADGRVEVWGLDPAYDEVFSLSCLDLDGDADPDGVEVVWLLDTDSVKSRIQGWKELCRAWKVWAVDAPVLEGWMCVKHNTHLLMTNALHVGLLHTYRNTAVYIAPCFLRATLMQGKVYFSMINLVRQSLER